MTIFTKDGYIPRVGDALFSQSTCACCDESPACDNEYLWVPADFDRFSMAGPVTPGTLPALMWTDEDAWNWKYSPGVVNATSMDVQFNFLTALDDFTLTLTTAYNLPASGAFVDFNQSSYALGCIISCIPSLLGGYQLQINFTPPGGSLVPCTYTWHDSVELIGHFVLFSSSPRLYTCDELTFKIAGTTKFNQSYTSELPTLQECYLGSTMNSLVVDIERTTPPSDMWLLEQSKLQLTIAS